MNYFWGNICEYFKDRRFASVFFGTLFFLVVALALGSLVYQVVGPDNLKTSFLYASPVMAVLLVVWIWRSIAQARARRRDRYKISPLSRDEMRKARSKLMRAK
jgi:hypothetical protein